MTARETATPEPDHASPEGGCPSPRAPEGLPDIFGLTSIVLVYYVARTGCNCRSACCWSRPPDRRAGRPSPTADALIGRQTRGLVMAIIVLLAAHWSLAAFVQASFHHRYASHRMFSLTPRAERLFHLLTYLVQGSSYLSPGAYAILHREHRAYSDEPGDPHAPKSFSNVLTMMWATAQRYGAHVDRTSTPEPRLLGGYPDWVRLDRFASRWPVRIGWGRPMRSSTSGSPRPGGSSCSCRCIG